MTRKMMFAARQKHRMERVPLSECHNARFNTAWRLMWLLMGCWGHVTSLEESYGFAEQTHVPMLGGSISDAIDGGLRTPTSINQDAARDLTDSRFHDSRKSVVDRPPAAEAPAASLMAIIVDIVKVVHDEPSAIC
jgi:hypothetical protein